MFLGLLPYGRNDGYLNGHDMMTHPELRQKAILLEFIRLNPLP
jgi:hypothetical protein